MDKALPFSFGCYWNINGDSNNLVCPIKDTKFYVSVVTLAAKGNQKLSTRFSEEFERSVC